MPRLHLAAFWISLVASTLAWADPPVPEVHKKVREIESAILRGKVDELRMKLQAQARNRPGDVLLRVYIAWCDMPADEAWNQLKGIAQIYPDHRWVRLGMGRVYMKWKMRDQADGEFNAALKVDPRFYPALVGLGDVLRRDGKLDEAAAKYQAALKLHDDAEAHGGLGLVYAAQQKWPEAKAALERSVQLWPDQPRMIAELARIAQAQKDLAGAAKWAEMLADLTPRDAGARRALADLKYEAGQKTEAAKDYERAIRLGVVDIEVYRRLAAIYRETNGAEGEQRAVEQLSVLERRDAAHPLRLSELAEARADLEASEAQVLEALDRAPARADLHARLARLRVKRENPREALDAYRAALAAKENPVDGLEAEAQALADKFELPKKPVRGGVEGIYSRVATSLNAFYKARLKQNPELAGWIKVRVRVEKDGQVAGADVIEDSVGDPYLAGHAYFALKGAVFPKQKREPVFEFELRPPKGKK